MKVLFLSVLLFIVSITLSSCTFKEAISNQRIITIRLSNGEVDVYKGDSAKLTIKTDAGLRVPAVRLEVCEYYEGRGGRLYYDSIRTYSLSSVVSYDWEDYVSETIIENYNGEKQ